MGRCVVSMVVNGEESCLELDIRSGMTIPTRVKHSYTSNISRDVLSLGGLLAPLSIMSLKHCAGTQIQAEYNPGHSSARNCRRNGFVVPRPLLATKHNAITVPLLLLSGTRMTRARRFATRRLRYPIFPFQVLSR